MKLKEQDFPDLLKKNFADTPAVLIYGPDGGKNNEFADKIIERLEIRSDNLITAGREDLRNRFDEICAEAMSVSMFGGAKLVLITDPDGRDADLVRQLCSSSPSLVVVAGEFDSKSAIRKWFEDSEKCIALPLYADDDQSLGTLVRGELNKLGIAKIDPDAMSYMLRHMGKDRAVARGFLKKIALYVDDKKTVSLDDAEKCLPDTGAANMDEFKYNLTAGNITATLRATDRLFAENVNPAQMVRTLGNHFKALLACAVGGIMPYPPVFWKYAGLFDAARRIWTESELSNALTRLNKLESDTRSGLDPAIIFRDFSLKLATRAYKLADARRRK
jgi:DNA polymerase-3 subunit delta